MLHTRQVSSASGSASAMDKFGKYKKEGDKTVRAPMNKEDTVLVQLQEAFRNTRFKGNYLEMIDANYAEAVSAISGIDYSAYDVEKLSVALANFTDIPDFPEKAGYFLSALINSGIDSDYIVHTKHLVHPDAYGKIEGMDFIGLMNTKNILIDGDAAQFIGYRMKSGRIILEGSTVWMIGDNLESGEIVVKGNGGHYAGNEMKGGRLVIMGNADTFLASGMKGGEIVLFGDSGEEPARYMKGGRVHIHGNIEDILQSVDGGEIHVDGEIGRLFGISNQARIFHKGIRVFPEE
jgi:hypothetical protein